MDWKLGRLAVAVLGLGLTSCGQTDLSRETSNQAAASLRAEIRGLNERANRLENEVKELREKAGHKPAYIDPAAADGYASFPTALGPLVVSLTAVEPIADGAKVHMLIGNPHAVTILGLNLDVGYGPRTTDSEWDVAMQRRDVKIVTTLLPGSWTKVDYSLPGITPDKLGFLIITGTTDRLSLRGAE